MSDNRDRSRMRGQRDFARQDGGNDQRDRAPEGGDVHGGHGQGDKPVRMPMDRDNPQHDPRDDPRQGHVDQGRPSGDQGRDLGRNRDEHLHGASGRGYGGLSNRDYEDRGPGRVFDRGEDYGRGDTDSSDCAGNTDSSDRAGHGSQDPGVPERERGMASGNDTDFAQQGRGGPQGDQRQDPNQRQGRLRPDR